MTAHRQAQPSTQSQPFAQSQPSAQSQEPDAITREDVLQQMAAMIASAAENMSMTKAEIMEELAKCLETQQAEEQTQEDTETVWIGFTPEMTAENLKDYEDTIILFGKRKGTTFKEIRDDPDYIKWLMTNTGKTSYPQAIILGQWLRLQYELVRIKKGDPMMLVDKATETVISGIMQGMSLKKNTPAEPTPETASNSQSQPSSQSQPQPSTQSQSQPSTQSQEPDMNTREDVLQRVGDARFRAFLQSMRSMP